MFFSKKRKNFYEALKAITFKNIKSKASEEYINSISSECSKLKKAIKEWKTTKQGNDNALQKSKSKPFLDDILKSVEPLCTDENLTKQTDEQPDKSNLKKLRNTILNAANAKFGLFTFNAVLDNNKIKNELRRISREINDLIGKGPIIGLPNRGNYCFLNSAIQQLYKIKTFREKVLDAKIEVLKTQIQDRDKLKKLYALQQIFKMLQNKLTMSNKDLNKYREDLGYKGEQEDSVEHMTRIKESIEQTLNINSINTLLIGAQNGKTVAKLINDEYVTRQDELPVCLVLESKKFMINIGRGNNKNAKIENISDTLDLATIDLVKNNLMNVYKSHDEEKFLDTNNLKFDLVGATIHSGNNTNSGHYFVYQKRPNGWHSINDNKVEKIDREYLNIVFNEIATSATLLVYKLKN